MASVAIFGLGIVMVADDFKEILMETEMAKQYVIFLWTLRLAGYDRVTDKTTNKLLMEIALY